LRYYLVENTTEARAELIYFHGNAGAACDRLSFSSELPGLSLRFVFLEYPGYGGDKKRPSEASFRQAARDLVLHRQKVSELPLILFGESMGSSVAIFTAAELSVAALILQAAAPSLAEVGSHHYPWLPVRWMMQNPFDARQAAQKLQAPVLMLIASLDKVIPPALSHSLANELAKPPRIMSLNRSGHNDMMFQDPDMYQNAISEFLIEVIPSLSAERD
jgi:pimeloyl-ACP methyl ester carboxylesterase